MYSLHAHTGISSASRGFTDSSVKLEDLIIRAKEIGLKGVAITDHEAIGSYVQAKQLEEKHDFPVICGNEIYLVSEAQADLLENDYQQGMYYPHFLLLALDEIGNRQIRELSTIAWLNSYTQRGVVRTPTIMSDVEKIIGIDKGHVVASTACLGSQVSKWIADMIQHSENEDRKAMRERQVRAFVEWCVDTFGEGNFYLECQPPSYIEGEQQDLQAAVNDYMLNLSKETGVPYIITSDIHYLSKELLPIHGAFLNSKDGGGEREVEEFYATAYLMNREEVTELFSPFWELEDIVRGLDNTEVIGNRAERYLMKQKQVIPKIPVEGDWKITEGFFPSEYKYIDRMIKSPHKQDVYLLYLIEQGMRKLIPVEDYQETFERVEQEVTELWYVSDIIGDRLGAYFVTIAKLVEIMWDEGDSIVGVGRGRAVASIIDYLLVVTQTNPLKMPVEMPF